MPIYPMRRRAYSPFFADPEEPVKTPYPLTRPCVANLSRPQKSGVALVSIAVACGAAYLFLEICSLLWHR